MILTKLNYSGYELEKKMTLRNFIYDIILKDKENKYKYYSVFFVKNFEANNMILFFKNSVLKSHHSSFSKMDYNDYLDFEIRRNYGTGIIGMDNIYSMDKDYIDDDCNLAKRPIYLKPRLEELYNCFEDEVNEKNKSIFEPQLKQVENEIRKKEKEIERLNQKKKWVEYRMKII